MSVASGRLQSRRWRQILIISSPSISDSTFACKSCRRCTISKRAEEKTWSLSDLTIGSLQMYSGFGCCSLLLSCLLSSSCAHAIHICDAWLALRQSWSGARGRGRSRARWPARCAQMAGAHTLNVPFEAPHW